MRQTPPRGGQTAGPYRLARCRTMRNPLRFKLEAPRKILLRGRLEVPKMAPRGQTTCHLAIRNPLRVRPGATSRTLLPRCPQARARTAALYKAARHLTPIGEVQELWRDR